jgi:hypothetical protein
MAKSQKCSSKLLSRPVVEECRSSESVFGSCRNHIDEIRRPRGYNAPSRAPAHVIQFQRECARLQPWHGRQRRGRCERERSKKSTCRSTDGLSLPAAPSLQKDNPCNPCERRAPRELAAPRPASSHLYAIPVFRPCQTLRFAGKCGFSSPLESHRDDAIMLAERGVFAGCVPRLSGMSLAPCFVRPPSSDVAIRPRDVEKTHQ